MQLKWKQKYFMQYLTRKRLMKAKEEKKMVIDLEEGLYFAYINLLAWLSDEIEIMEFKNEAELKFLVEQGKKFALRA